MSNSARSTLGLLCLFGVLALAIALFVSPADVEVAALEDFGSELRSLEPSDSLLTGVSVNEIPAARNQPEGKLSDRSPLGESACNSIRVRVTDSAGLGISKVELAVIVDSIWSDYVVTNAEGWVEFNLAPSQKARATSFELLVKVSSIPEGIVFPLAGKMYSRVAKGNLLVHRAFRLRDEEAELPSEIIVIGQRAAGVAGDLESGNGSKVANRRVWLRNLEGDSGVTNMVTNENGGFAFDGLYAGQWRLGVDRSNDPANFYPDLTITLAEGENAWCPVTGRSGVGSIRGQVIDQDGIGVRELDLEIREEDQLIKSLQTSEDGRFDTGLLPVGFFALDVGWRSLNGRSGQPRLVESSFDPVRFSIEGDSRSDVGKLSVRRPGIFRLGGTVEYSNGEVAAGVRLLVHIRLLDGESNLFRTIEKLRVRTNGSGDFEFRSERIEGEAQILFVDGTNDHELWKVTGSSIQDERKSLILNRSKPLD